MAIGARGGKGEKPGAPEMMLLPVLLTLGAGRTAALKATALFADGVVLQTSDDGGPGARVTGVAASGASVTLSGLPQQSSATAGADGKFSLPFNEKNPLNYVKPITVNIYFKQSNPGVGYYDPEPTQKSIPAA